MINRCNDLTTSSITYLRSCNSTHDEHKNPRSSNARFNPESGVTEESHSRENEVVPFETFENLGNVDKH